MQREPCRSCGGFDDRTGAEHLCSDDGDFEHHHNGPRGAPLDQQYDLLDDDHHNHAAT